jgi:hypothetical protein
MRFCSKNQRYRSEDGMQLGRDYPYGVKGGAYWVLRGSRGEVLSWNIYADNLAEAYGLELIL